MRVLIVEDERRLARTLADLMEAHNYTADLAYDGETGLDDALSGIYDVILLDVMLPKRNGYEVARQLRAAGNRTPGADAHRPDGGGRPDHRSGLRRGLLSDKAL